MGYLTTITIYNDGADQIKEHPEKFAEIVYDACSNTNKQKQFGLGNHCNLITAQKTRHMDDSTLYLHAGNTLIDVNEVNSNWAIETFISEMEYHLKRLKKLKKTNHE